MKLHHILSTIFLLFSFKLSFAQCLGGNCTNGWGTYEWDSGDKYTGQWMDGARTGIGVYDWKNGSFYYGYFQDGKLEGDGFYIGLDSSEDQIGVFHNGTLSYAKSFGSSGCVLGNCTDGSGVYLWETNDLYIGQWQSGGRTGYGRYDWDDGGWYIGYFTDGKLDGEGEYHPKGKDVMKGKFSMGSFLGSTSSNSSDQYAATPPSSSSALNAAASHTGSAKANEGEMCAVMKNVIADYPNNFENIKGNKDEADDYSLGDSWDATWKVSGSSEAKISAPLTSGHSTWYCTLYESTSFSDARAKYDSYVSTVKSCGSNCCTLVFDTHDYKGDSYSSYLTYWLPLTVKEGYSDDYKNMEIEIELSQKIVDEGWEIVARVMELKD